MPLDLFGQSVGARNKRSLDRERTVGEKWLSICLHNWQKIEDGRENKIVEMYEEQIFPPIMRRGPKLGNAKWYKNANQRGEKDGCVTRPHRELRTDWLEFCRVSFRVKSEKNCKKSCTIAPFRAPCCSHTYEPNLYRGHRQQNYVEFQYDNTLVNPPTFW